MPALAITSKMMGSVSVWISIRTRCRHHPGTDVRSRGKGGVAPTVSRVIEDVIMRDRKRHDRLGRIDQEVLVEVAAENPRIADSD
jgi:hypothetical protein